MLQKPPRVVKEICLVDRTRRLLQRKSLYSVALFCVGGVLVHLLHTLSSFCKVCVIFQLCVVWCCLASRPSLPLPPTARGILYHVSVVFRELSRKIEASEWAPPLTPTTPPKKYTHLLLFLLHFLFSGVPPCGTSLTISTLRFLRTALKVTTTFDKSTSEEKRETLRSLLG